MAMRNIIIFDSTLRDAEQAPGGSLNLKEKVEVARQLALLNVDVIEAGFPISSPGDFEAVNTIAREVPGVAIAGLCRCVAKDIDRAAEALKPAETPRIHVFIGTSPIHRKGILRKGEAEILKMAVEAVKRARSYVADVEFSAMDATRTEREYLVEIVSATIDAGAGTVNIPDTVGYAIPEQFADLIAHLRSNVENLGRTVISVHCHNDLGLATANSLAAVKAGADQVECNINGLGERAGNAALEEVVMAIRTRPDFFDCQTRIVANRIVATSKLLSSLTGLHVQRNKAIVGENAFAHESGVHQDGMLKDRATFEIMRPEDVGWGKSRLVLGKHSGRHALKERIEELGYTVSDEELNVVFEQFKVLADKKKEVFDEDIEALLEERMAETPDVYKIESFHVTSGTQTIPTATLRMRDPKGKVTQDAATGDGPIDAIYRTMDRITGTSGRLCDYKIRAVTSGKDALGEVTVEVEFNGTRLRARAVSTDVIEASAKAYLNAINRYLVKSRKQKMR
jgi:2-isopropylmalate synthase